MSKIINQYFLDRLSHEQAFAAFPVVEGTPNVESAGCHQTIA
tara:strand:+ start:746 stop:871 length:126 start_codon:yes stop_codon:yes gene_type:complete